MDKRRGRVQWGPNGTRSLTKTWGDPVRWNKAAAKFAHELSVDAVFFDEPEPERPRVFVASLADVFEDWAGPIVDHQGNLLVVDDLDGGRYRPTFTGDTCRSLTLDDLRADLFRLIDATPNLDWLLLTKRPENVRRMWPTEDDGHDGLLASAIFAPDGHDFEKDPLPKGKLVRRRDNVWIGTSVSDQETADAQIPELLKCRDLAAKLFVSAEPMLGPVDWEYAGAWGSVVPVQEPWSENGWTPTIDWVIFGGESGPNARLCNVDWIRDGVEQCREAGVATFVKQLGANSCGQYHPPRPGPQGGGGMLTSVCSAIKDPKGGDPDEWPEDLRVREVPHA